MLRMSVVVYTLEEWPDPLVGLEFFPKTSVMLKLQEQMLQALYIFSNCCRMGWALGGSWLDTPAHCAIK